MLGRRNQHDHFTASLKLTECEQATKLNVLHLVRAISEFSLLRFALDSLVAETKHAVDICCS